ncbi:hypothetical protein Tco_1576894 [Tanacetum coccineum]
MRVRLVFITPCRVRLVGWQPPRGALVGAVTAQGGVWYYGSPTGVRLAFIPAARAAFGLYFHQRGSANRSATSINEDEEADEVHATTNVETEDTLVPKSSSPRSSQIQELTNQFLILQSQKHKLELEKNKAEVEAAFPNAGQLSELLVKSLQTEFSKILSAYDFSSSLPTELKELPSKFNELTEEVKGLKKKVHELEIELPGDLKEFPSTLEDFTRTVTSLTSQVAELKTLQWELPAEFLSMPTQVEKVQTKLKTLDALPSLLNKVTNVLNQFA